MADAFAILVVGPIEQVDLSDYVVTEVRVPAASAHRTSRAEVREKDVAAEGRLCAARGSNQAAGPLRLVGIDRRAEQGRLGALVEARSRRPWRYRSVGGVPP